MDAEAERRLKVRKKRAERERQRDQDLYPGINDLSDALEAMPAEVVRHFTLLREIDAKCIGLMPVLKNKTNEFFQYPIHPEDESIKKDRDDCLAEIRRLIRELMPCQEEKMHVAGVAAEAVARHVSRMNFDYDLIVKNEIPESVRFGPIDHPAILTDSKQNEQAKNASTSRSESRREALAAKKAAAAASQDKKIGGSNGSNNSNNSNGHNGGVGGRTSTPVNGGGRSKPGPKPKQKGGSAQNGGGGGSTSGGKRRRNDESTAAEDDDDMVGSGTGSRPDTPNNNSSGSGLGHSMAGSSGNGSSSSKRSRQRNNRPKDEDKDVYCYCQQVSFGDMVGCDGPDCKLEWFHLPCIGLASPPKGQWYCDECAVKHRKSKRS